MRAQVHSIDFSASDRLLDFVQQKVDKLDHFYDRIVGKEIYLRLVKSQDTSNKVAELKLNIPGRELFAKKQCKTFEEATDNAVEAIRKQLTKHKGKIVDKTA